MGHLVRLPLRVLLLAGLGVAPLLAQSTYEVKVRSGMTAGPLKDELHNTKLMGLAVEGAFPMAGKGAVVFQLDYTYVPGGDYDNMRTSTWDGRTLAVTSSADRRKFMLEGFSARAGFRAPLFGDVDWQAGLALNRFKGREEVSGTLRPTNATTVAQYESLAYTPSQVKLSPSIYAGVKYRINDAVSLEANAMSVGFNTIKWQPYWYTGTNSAAAGQPLAGTTKTESKTGFAVEFAIGLRL